MKRRIIISSESLKRVILQVDFSGLMEESLVEWVNTNRNLFAETFSRFDRAERGSVKLDISHPERFTLENGPDVREVNRGVLFLYQEGSFRGLKDKLRLEISSSRIVLTVDCIEYVSSEPYRDYICTLWELLLNHDRFVRFESMGLRKLDLFNFRDEKDLLENISPMAMNLDLWNGGKDFLERTFRDRYVFEATDSTATVLDYARHMRFVKSGEPQDKGKIQVIVDMDSRYYTKVEPRLDREAIEEIAKQMNDRLYSFFEDSVTPQYKKTHEREI